MKRQRSITGYITRFWLMWLRKQKKNIYLNKKVSKSSNKCKAMWDIINEITGHRHNKIDPQDLKVDHKHITNPEEIAEMFNKYFSA